MPAKIRTYLTFKHLHSFAFNLFRIKQEDVMQPYHYEKFGKKLNVKVKY